MKYVILSLCLVTSALADHLTPCPPVPGQNCLRSCCTDDVAHVWGNEAIAWDQNPGWESRSCPDPVQECTPEGQKRCYSVGFSEDGVNFEELWESCERTALHWDEEAQWFFWAYTPPRTRFYPYAQNPPYFPTTDGIYYYKVKACYGALGDLDRLCSAWTTDTAEITGGIYTCMDTPPGCESFCFQGAPYRLPQRPGCP